MGILKSSLKRIIYSFGFELNRIGKITLGWNFESLKKVGIYPNTIFDVGVGRGTPMLYKNFPNSYFVLIKPLVENEPYLKRIIKKFNGEYFLTAVGEKVKEIDFFVDPILKERSSMKKRTSFTKTGFETEIRKIKINTLDNIIEGKSFKKPYGLKIDTEGFEYEVILGARKILNDTDFVIAEISVEKRFEDSYTFSDFIQLMDKNNFRLYDIINIGRLKLSAKKLPKYSNIYFIDAIFLNKYHCL